LKSHVFTNPNSAIGGDRKALPHQSPKEHQDTPTDRYVGANLLHLNHHDSGKTGGGFSQLIVNTPNSGENVSNLVDMNPRSKSLNDTLGKRQPLTTDIIDSELLYRDPLYGSKRLLNENSVENALFMSPVQNSKGKNGSGSASPANSFKGGFKLHSSRKNSGAMDPIGELRASPIVLTRNSQSSGNS
jgi:hypothetical protein